eukprot:5358644-Amphidinium_carterae.1
MSSAPLRLCYLNASRNFLDVLVTLDLEQGDGIAYPELLGGQRESVERSCEGSEAIGSQSVLEMQHYA